MTRRLIVIPAHNEQETIREVVTRALQYGDVSVTDDGSTDKTPKFLSEIKQECLSGHHQNHLHVITHPKATHIPAGIQDGMKYAVQNHYSFVMTMDAGLSHDPDTLERFIRFDEHTDIVIGSRSKTENVPLYRKLVSYVGSRMINYVVTDSYISLFGPGIKDCTSGFRRYSQRAVDKIAAADLKSLSFDFHMEALAICLRKGMSVAEIPITYIFSNSSFNGKILFQAARFAFHLLRTKKCHI